MNELANIVLLKQVTGYFPCIFLSSVSSYNNPIQAALLEVSGINVPAEGKKLYRPLTAVSLAGHLIAVATFNSWRVKPARVLFEYGLNRKMKKKLTKPTVRGILFEVFFDLVDELQITMANQ